MPSLSIIILDNEYIFELSVAYDALVLTGRYWSCSVFMPVIQKAFHVRVSLHLYETAHKSPLLLLQYGNPVPCLLSQLEDSTGEFKALRRIVLAAFGAVG